ncbi:MAG: helix-turn-helix transcriptional regulator [Ruminococcaceae bacterium]|nr:helix-turn-helix transcriptional regulator [Oscillospiraceae bacterium]
MRGDLMRLRDMREDNDLKQEHIAKLLNVKQNTYSQYENGKREIPLQMLWKLADYYNTSIDYLIGRTDEKDFIKRK